MTPDEARWVRDHAWTRQMRDASTTCSPELLVGACSACAGDDTEPPRHAQCVSRHHGVIQWPGRLCDSHGRPVARVLDTCQYVCPCDCRPPLTADSTQAELDYAEGRCCGDDDAEHEPASGYIHYPTDRVHYPLTYWEWWAIREITPWSEGHVWDGCLPGPCLGCCSGAGPHRCTDGDPLPEGGLISPDRGLLAYVWLADRVCRRRCTCVCATGDPWAEPEPGPEGAVQPSLFAGVLFGARWDSLSGFGDS